jgi:type 1 glutamine amidotransferase
MESKAMNIRTNRRTFALICGVVVGLAGGVRGAEPLRVRILSGKNVHDWQSTTPELHRIYQESGRFKVVEVVNDPSRCTAASLLDCDVVVCNWTAHPEMHGHPWGEAAEKAVAEFVRGGKGFVAFHAASTAYYDWADFQRMVALTWKWEFTSHTAYATFKVAIEDQDHPITHGLSDFWTTDELYQNMVTLTNFAPAYQVLCKAFARADIGGTGRFEPMLITTHLGQGRGLNLLLGHDVAAMRNVGFRTLLLRGTEWAAAAAVTIPVPPNWPATAAAAAVTGLDSDAVLQAAATYRFGQPRLALHQLEQLVIAAHSAPGETGRTRRQQLAANAAALLRTDIAPEAKAFLCKQLALIATEEQVPAVRSLLLDEPTSDAARSVLESIPARAAGDALRQALPQAKGRIRLGMINSLGNRAEVESVALLAPLLGDVDETIVASAAAALGKIGGDRAAQALAAAWDKASGGSRAALADALQACAERLGAGGVDPRFRAVRPQRDSPGGKPDP